MGGNVKYKVSARPEEKSSANFACHIRGKGKGSGLGLTSFGGSG